MAAGVARDDLVTRLITPGQRFSGSAAVYASNLSSVRVLEKAGFRQEGVWRRQLLGLGGREDHVWFGLLAEEHQGWDRPNP